MLLLSVLNPGLQSHRPLCCPLNTTSPSLSLAFALVASSAWKTAPAPLSVAYSPPHSDVSSNFTSSSPSLTFLHVKLTPSGCFNQLSCFPPDYLINISHTYVLICLLVCFCLLHWNVSPHEGRALSCLLLYLWDLGQMQ